MIHEKLNNKASVTSKHLETLLAKTRRSDDKSLRRVSLSSSLLISSLEQGHMVSATLVGMHISAM